MTQHLTGNKALLTVNPVPEDFGKTSWVLGSRVTLIGDAVHIMGPTSELGAIVGLRDAATVCRMVVEDNFENLSGTIKRYETEMRDYATQTVSVSSKSGSNIFGHGPDNDVNVGEFMMISRQRKH